MSSPSFSANRLAFETPSSSAQTPLLKEFEAQAEACAELEQKMAEIQNKLPTMASPAYRSNAQNRLRMLSGQLKNKRSRQRSMGLQLRMGLVREHLAQLTQQKHALEPEVYVQELCQNSLPPIQEALTEPPYGGKAWVTPLQLAAQHLSSLKQVLASGSQAQLKAAFKPLKNLALPDKANPQEKGLVRRYILLVENALLQWMGQHTGPTLKQVSSTLSSPKTVQAQTPKSPLQGMGELQISFSGGKTVVKDQLGVQVNKAQRAFDDLLSDGIEAMESAFHKPPPKLPLIQAAVTHFSEAMSSEPKRFEPYFSMGYIFANLEDWPRAIMLLEAAHTISQRSDIETFLKEVQAAARGSQTWSSA